MNVLIVVVCFGCSSIGKINLHSNLLQIDWCILLTALTHLYKNFVVYRLIETCCSKMALQSRFAASKGSWWISWEIHHLSSFTRFSFHIWWRRYRGMGIWSKTLGSSFFSCSKQNRALGANCTGLYVYENKICVFMPALCMKSNYKFAFVLSP